MSKTFYECFLNKLFSVEFSEMYMILNESVIPSIKHYMQLIINTPFHEELYHTFYGNLKNTIESFHLFWSQTMDKNIKTANGYMNALSTSRSLTKESIITLMGRSINARVKLQKDFVEEFLELNTNCDVKHIDSELERHVLKMQELIRQVETLDYQELEKFVTTNIYSSVKSEHNILEFASNQFSIFLAENHKKILISLEENFKRVSRNIQLFTQLKPGKNINYSVSEAVCCKSMKYAMMYNISEEHQVNEELKLWQKKIHEFLHIKNNLDKLERVKVMLLEQQSQPPLNESAMQEINQKLEEVKKLEMDVSKSILTFFSVEGADRLFHSDTVGTFFMDEYGHRVYSINYGLNRFHTCGDYFEEVHEDAKPYYDEVGRYVVKDNQKLYKPAPCCSAYKLDEWGVFNKDPDSRFHNHCKEDIKKSYYDTMRAQEKEFAKQKKKINKKSAIYLWNSLGGILTKSLLDVAKLQPENPIHCLAHTLLYYKYHKKPEDTSQLEGRLLPKTENVFKTTKTPTPEERKTEVWDADQEVISFNTNIVQQYLYNLIDQ